MASRGCVFPYSYNLDIYINPLRHACYFQNMSQLYFRWSCHAKSRITWDASSEFGTYSICEQRRFRRACADPRSLAWTFAARLGDKYQIRLMRPISYVSYNKIHQGKTFSTKASNGCLAYDLSSLINLEVKCNLPVTRYNTDILMNSLG